MADASAQKDLWEVRKAGLNIMMAIKGDGKPVSLHRGLRGAARAPRRLHRRADRGVRASTAPTAPGTRMPRSAPCTCARSSTCVRADRRAAPRRCAPSPRRPPSWCASTRAPIAASMATALCRGEWIAWQFGPRSRKLSARSSDASIRRPVQPRQDHRSAEAWTTRAVPLRPPGYSRLAAATALDWSPGTCRTIRSRKLPARDRRRSGGGFAKAVEMCNNNGHCRKFDAGTMCPSYRVTRDEQHLTRGRANTLRLALSGQLGPDAFTGEAMHETHGSLRRLQGLQARVPDRRRHGADEDRVPGTNRRATAHAAGPADRICRSWAPWARALPFWQICATRCPARRASETLAGRSARACCRMAPRHLPAESGRGDDPAAAARRRAVRRYLQRYFETENVLAALRVLQAAGYRPVGGGSVGRRAKRPFAAAAPTSPPAWSSEPARSAAADRRAAADWRQASPSSAWSRPAC